MPKMFMDRDWTVATDRGHTIRFVKGQQVNVPDDYVIVQECLRFGAKMFDPKEEVIDAPSKKANVLSPQEQKAALREFLGKMAAEPAAYRDGFTAMGKPGVRYVAKQINVETSKEELEAVWKDIVASTNTE